VAFHGAADTFLLPNGSKKMLLCCCLCIFVIVKCTTLSYLFIVTHGITACNGKTLDLML